MARRNSALKLSRFWMKFCTVLVALLFITSTLAEASSWAIPPLATRLSQPEEILSGLSAEVCDIQNFWISKEGKGKSLGEFPLVILLQEAHVNYLAQKNIVATLEHFQNKFEALGLPEKITIGLEGSPLVEINPILFRAFPIPEITRDVSGAFLREGKMDGAEFYAINSNRRARLFGIEEAGLYDKNLKAYRSFVPDQPKCLTNLKKLRTEIETLKAKVYSKHLRNFEESRRRLEKDIQTLPLHLALLTQLAKLKQITPSPLPFSLLEGEDRVRVMLETLPELENRLYETLPRSQDEKMLVFADRASRLLEKLAEFALTSRDFIRLKTDWKKIRDPEIWLNLDDLFKRRGIGFETEPSIHELLRRLEPAIDFYELAQKRDRALAENLQKLMRKQNQNIVFAVTGGFHREGVTQLLRKKGISYWALAPKPDLRSDSSKYWKLLSNISTLKPPRQGPVPETALLLAASAMFYDMADGRSLGALNPNLSYTRLEAWEHVIRDYVKELWAHEQEDTSIREALDILASFLDKIVKLRKENVALDPNMFSFEIRDRFHRSFQIQFQFTNQNLNPNLRKDPEETDWQPATQENREPSLAALMIQEALPFVYIEKLGRYFRLRVTQTGTSPLLKPDAVTEAFKNGAAAPIPLRAPPQINESPTLREAILPNLPPALALHDPIWDPPPPQVDYEAIFKEALTRSGQFTTEPVQIGEGGMGLVFKAKQIINGKERTVAIKTLRSEHLSEKEDLKRFELEAKALKKARLKKGVVEFYDLGKVDIPPYGEVPYFVMEFIEGSNLENLIEEMHRVPLHLAFRLIRNNALAFYEVHKLGLVHRDIKPSNIALKRVKKDPSGVHIEEGNVRGYFTPVVMDFGLVKFKVEASTNALKSQTRVTKEGMLLGTPVYMAPEQADELLSTVIDRRADIYSLAATLFRMITGTIPIHGQDNNIHTLLARLLVPKDHEDALNKSLEKLNELKLSENQRNALQTIFKTALAHDRDKRYPTMALFAQALEKFLDENKEIIPQEPDPAPTAPPVVRMDRRTLIFSSISSLIAGAGAAGILVYFASRPAKPAPTDEKEELLEKLRKELSMLEQAVAKPYLAPEEIRLEIERAGNLITSRFFPKLSSMEQGHVHRNLGYLLRLSGPHRNEEASNRAYENAAMVFEKAYQETKMPEAFWLKARAEARREAYVLSNGTLKRLIQEFPASELAEEADFLMAENLMVSAGYSDAKHSEARAIFSKYFRDMARDLDPKPADAKEWRKRFLNFRARMGFMDSYLLENAAIRVAMRNLAEKSMPEAILYGYDYELFKELTKLNEQVTLLISKTFGEDNRQVKEINEWSQYYMYRWLAGLVHSTETGNIQQEELREIPVANKLHFNFALPQELNLSLQNFKVGIPKNIDTANMIHSNFIGLAKNVPQNTRPQFEPFLTAHQVMTNGIDEVSEKRMLEGPHPDRLKGLLIFASALKDRRKSFLAGVDPIKNTHIVERERSTAQEAGRKFSEAAELLHQDPVSRALAKILATESRLYAAKSLGEKGRPYLFMEFDRERLEEFLARKKDPRVASGNPSQAVIFRVDSEHIKRNLEDDYGQILKDHGIFLVKLEHPLAEMTPGDLRKLLGRARVILGSDLSLNQMVFLNHAFKPDWGNREILRIKFDGARFKEKNYRSAILTAVLEGLRDRSKWKDSFQFNEEDQSYGLLPQVLDRMILALKEKKQPLISA